jgi:hypothetical protein
VEVDVKNKEVNDLQKLLAEYKKNSRSALQAYRRRASPSRSPAKTEVIPTLSSNIGPVPSRVNHADDSYAEARRQRLQPMFNRSNRSHGNGATLRMRSEEDIRKSVEDDKIDAERYRRK